MRKIIVALLAMTLMQGCAKLVQVPTPPDVSAQLRVIAESNLSPEQKPIMMERILAAAKEQYQMLLDRLAAKGSNYKEVMLTVITTLSAIATPFVIAYTR